MREPASGTEQRRELAERLVERVVVAQVEEPLERPAARGECGTGTSGEGRVVEHRLLELLRSDDSVDSADAKRMLRVEGHAGEDVLERVAGGEAAGAAALARSSARESPARLARAKLSVGDRSRVVRGAHERESRSERVAVHRREHGRSERRDQAQEPDERRRERDRIAARLDRSHIEAPIVPGSRRLRGGRSIRSHRVAPTVSMRTLGMACAYTSAARTVKLS